jgi:AAHS family 4-hydroxybenzoate transporter-like MFS transporter
MPAKARAPIVIFLVALGTWTLSNMDQSLFGYAVPDLIAEFGISIDWIGRLISLSFVAGILTAAVAGVATDTWGAKWTLPFCLGLSALLVGVQGFAASATGFAVLRVSGYAFSATLSPITSALVANLYGEKRRPMMVSILQCGVPLGWFIASFAVAPLIRGHGWRLPFMVAFAVIPIAILFFFLLPRRDRVVPPAAAATASAAATGGNPFGRLLCEHLRKALICTAIFFLYGGAIAGTIYYLPTFFREVRGYDAATAAQIVGLSYGISMIGYVGSAIVSQRWLSRRTTAMIFLSTASVTVLAMLWLPRTIGEDIAIFSVSTIFFFGSASILTVYLLEIFPREVRATAAGVCASGGLCAGSVLFPMVVAGLTGALGWQMALTVTVPPLLLISALLLLGLPRRG